MWYLSDRGSSIPSNMSLAAENCRNAAYGKKQPARKTALRNNCRGRAQAVLIRSECLHLFGNRNMQKNRKLHLFKYFSEAFNASIRPSFSSCSSHQVIEKGRYIPVRQGLSKCVFLKTSAKDAKHKGATVCPAYPLPPETCPETA